MEHPYLMITGPDSEETTRYEIQQERVTIGRLEAWNDVALFPDPQQLITRKAHCTIEYTEARWWLIDNASVNRTLLRHQPDQPPEVLQGRIPLNDGDVVCILGHFLEDGSQRYWQLKFYDPASTRPAGPGDLTASHST